MIESVDILDLLELTGDPTESVLQPLFQLAKEYDKIVLIKQRVDLGPQVFRTRQLSPEHKPRELNWQMKYHISVGLVKNIGVFVNIQLRGKGSRPKKVLFKSEALGLNAKELADILKNYNVRLKELEELLRFEQKKRGKKLKGIKQDLTKYMSAKYKGEKSSRLRRKVLGKDVSLDLPNIDPSGFVKQTDGSYRYKPGKFSQDEVGYTTDPPKRLPPAQRCGMCKYFDKPSTCVVVVGKVKATAWCGLWSRFGVD